MPSAGHTPRDTPRLPHRRTQRTIQADQSLSISLGFVCEFVATLVAEPEIHHQMKNGEHFGTANLVAMVAGPNATLEPPPADQYLSHLLNTLAARACMDRRVQRQHCRDHSKSRRRKTVAVIKIDIPRTVGDIEKDGTLKQFGDLVTSDSIFTIKRGSTSYARYGDATALGLRDRGAGWLAACPSNKESSDNIKDVVNDFNGSGAINRWYLDGAPELHAACRDLGIRHDTSDPHRSETDGANALTNRTMIDGASCCRFQSGLPFTRWSWLPHASHTATPLPMSI